MTLGVEEEFHLVDLTTRCLTPRAREVLDGLSASVRTYAAELQQSVVETNTEVVVTLDALRHKLVDLRSELAAAARVRGLGVASAGMVPLSVPDLAITDTPRFRRMLADYQLLVREQLICGMQVHVGIGDREIAVALLDRVSPWLPPLLALSASSPFAHTGEDTGYASTRSLVWSRWPTAGGPGPLASAAEYDALVRSLVASGVISDPGMIYFDVRPSSHVPTIELRVCDACPSVDTVVLIAALFRAVVVRELGRYEGGEPSNAVSPALHRAAMWRAARSGLEGELVDLSGPGPCPPACSCAAWSTSFAPSSRRTATGRRSTSSATPRSRKAARRLASARRSGAAIAFTTSSISSSPRPAVASTSRSPPRARFASSTGTRPAASTRRSSPTAARALRTPPRSSRSPRWERRCSATAPPFSSARRRPRG